MRTKFILALTLTALAQLVPGSVAQAAGDSGTVASGSTYCLTESSLVRSDSAGDFYSRGRVRSFKPGCSDERNRPVPFLSQTFYLLFMKTQGGTQSVCSYSQFFYNEKPEYAFAVELPFEDTTYCGPGWYNVRAYGYIWENKRWNGGYIESGWEHLSL